MRTVLIVDKDKSDRDYLRFLLRNSKYDFEIFDSDNGKDAVESISIKNPDIILTDIKLSLINGIRVIEQALKINPDIAAVILSESKEFEDARKAIRLGVKGYLLKPVQEAEFYELLDKIWRLLNQKKEKDSHFFEQAESALGEKTEEEYEGQPEELTSLIIQNIRHKNINGVKDKFEILCNKYLGEASFSQIYVKFVFSSIIKELNMHMTDIEQKVIEKEIEELYQCTKIADVIKIAEKNIKRFEKHIVNSEVRNEIQSIKKYIYENYQHDISVELLAEKVGLSPSYLSSIFKKETGENLSKFMKNYRMERAEELLVNTNKKVINICEEVGYTNVSYFCQNFKEYYGVSPERFRQSGRVYVYANDYSP